MITVKQILELNIGDKIIDVYSKEIGTIIMFNRQTFVFSVNWSGRGMGMYYVSEESRSTPEKKITHFNLFSATKQLEFEF